MQYRGSYEDEDLEYHYKALPRCMWTLLIHVTFLDDLSGVLNVLMDVGDVNTFLAVFVFMIFVRERGIPERISTQ